MVAMRPCRFALPNAAESATVLGGFARRNLPIAHPLASGLSGASGLRLSGRSASLQILAHVAAIAVGQGGVRIRHAAAMRCIVGPCASSTQAGAASGVEIVAMNEAVIDKDAVAAPAEPPTPSAPSTPSAAKIQSHRYAHAKAEVAVGVIPTCVWIVQRRPPDKSGVVVWQVHHLRIGPESFVVLTVCWLVDDNFPACCAFNRIRCTASITSPC